MSLFSAERGQHLGVELAQRLVGDRLEFASTSGQVNAHRARVIAVTRARH